MGLKSKIKTFFLLDDEYDDMEEEKMGHETDYEPEPAPRNNHATAKHNIVSLQSVKKGSKVVLIEPRVYAEAQEIADHLKNNRSVVVNLQRIQHDQAKRIIDFLSGTVYAIGGDIQRIGSNIFLCTPDNVEVSGNISEFIQDNNFDSRWS
ncbi:cell division protein SepF [Bacillus sp. FJAT-49736]|uniref:cell division protein SepF n=1 Tax=Bacillus sp. FJAT-49736 TaxID=2833582 RepID=UPI001BCA3C98|nr:cell division protein SepF [Bacillus sp. FJAT-49736]MBS4172440.1 cell division protein SepF [Bacillus sp. FJAT-49736]